MTYTKQQWYTPAEIAVHNIAGDCWVSLNGKVFDLTTWLYDQFRLCRCTKTCSCEAKSWYCEDTCVEYCPCFKQGFLYCDGKRLAMTILAYAGKDVSHWFKGDEWVRYTHPIVGSTITYQQHGHGIRQPVVPSTKWRPVEKPWWLNEELVVGKATAKTRPIRITNTLTGTTATLEVCSEETLYEIMMRYYPHNRHLSSYTWRYLGKPLCYNQTLAENGIPDERDRFSDVLLPENIHIPAILIYYDDDLTEDPPKNYCTCGDYKCILGLKKCKGIPPADQG
ncbi:cytochrome b5 domain-containing protein 1 [Anticarsia gemmatalis]|uniref:cytochrome b5 domain-containing protein 1 n=1 Tax=Anticarsia gemmatalis TaxID=129554 RepID=UPI003F7635DD